MVAQERQCPGYSLGKYLPEVEAALADLQRREVVGRIWRRDHTVWKDDPGEIANRLGWLTVTDTMAEQVPVLEAFAREVREAGFKHVVLLGMGGSSLGPEVLRQTLGNAAYPKLIVLDSTVPGWVKAVSEAIDLSRTLFLVSSKSGSTIEPNVFYAYFRSLVERVLGFERAGQNFAAITDPGTPLAALARTDRFRRVFSNPPDMGGRYSVLSYFGLVPAALTGVDTAKLLDRADAMREKSASSTAARENPAARLGTAMGVLVKQGRDKLTLATSPSIACFGLWAEQLLAESTGKEGTGVVPVVGEPPVKPDRYGQDRFFVYLRLDGDDNGPVDAAIRSIEASGQPVVRLNLGDEYDLGGEFYRWELATAIAGSLLRINPFDQPNVQSAKDITERVLNQFASSGKLPEVEALTSLSELLAHSREGGYLAIMAYLKQTPEVDRALESLRRAIAERYRIATTVGYGPRFLHSTGQLHKGGPDSGLFLQITTKHHQNVPIPGRAFSFGVLADAQAGGDLEALLTAGRPAAQMRLDSDPGISIENMARELA